MTTRTVALLLSSIAAVAISTTAFAAPAPAPAGAAATSPSDDNSIQEIVVTAEKRTENLEKVPDAVTAYTSKMRDLIGIETIQDMTNFTPGLAYSTVLDRAFIRGVGRETNNLATQPGVATYSDGLYNSSVVAASRDSMFIDRVEILRGPQGTLYGRNAIAGTIDSISKRPTPDWEAEVRANFGNFGVHNVEGAVSGPISDTMRVRFAGSRDTQEDGYFTDVANGKQVGGNGNFFYWQAQLEWDITPDMEFWLKIEQLGYDQSYFTANAGGSYDYNPYPPGTLSPGPAFGYTQPGFNNLGPATQNPGIGDLRDYSADMANNAKLTRTYSFTPQFTWHTPWASDLKYVGGYTTYNYNLHTDYDGTSMLSYTFPTAAIPGSPCFPAACPPLTVFPQTLEHYVENKKYFSNELNLTSHSDSNLQWIVGLYEYNERYNQPIALTQPNQPQLAQPFNLTVTGLAAPNPEQNIYANTQDMHGNSYAVFAQTDWKFQPTWKLTTGLRYTRDYVAGAESFRELCFGLPACLALPNTLPGPLLLGAFTPVNDITSTAPGIAAGAAGNYRGVTSLPVLNTATGFWWRGLGDVWGAVTGTAGVEWTPNDSTLGYLKYSRGYKSGGFNSGSGMVASPESNPEHIDALELGGKETFNKQLQINGAIFYYNYKDLQIPLTVQPNTGPAISSIINLPKVRSYGAEFETVWQPIANLQFLFDYSYMSATVTESGQYTNNVNGVTGSVDGETVPQSPRNKVSANGNYTWHFTPGSLNFSASYIWKDKTYDSIFNEPYFLAPSYSRVDSRLTWTDASDRYTVFFYGKNLQNKLGYENVTAGPIATPAAGFPPYSSSYELTPPRTYGVELQFRMK
jgi:iron complex outermembrane recepter protein